MKFIMKHTSLLVLLSIMALGTLIQAKEDVTFINGRGLKKGSNKGARSGVRSGEKGEKGGKGGKKNATPYPTSSPSNSPSLSPSVRPSIPQAARKGMDKNASKSKCSKGEKVIIDFDDIEHEVEDYYTNYDRNTTRFPVDEATNMSFVGTAIDIEYLKLFLPESNFDSLSPPNVGINFNQTSFVMYCGGGSFEVCSLSIGVWYPSPVTADNTNILNVNLVAYDEDEKYIASKVVELNEDGEAKKVKLPKNFKGIRSLTVQPVGVVLPFIDQYPGEFGYLIDDIEVVIESECIEGLEGPPDRKAQTLPQDPEDSPWHGIFNSAPNDLLWP